MVRAWHLAILCFAVTRNSADRLGIFAIAGEIDGLGEHREQKAQFGFFCKMSAELCDSILWQSETSAATLQQYLTRIDDARLQRTFAAAIGIDQRNLARTMRHARQIA
jgi:hypothetical protein